MLTPQFLLKGVWPTPTTATFIAHSSWTW